MNQEDTLTFELYFSWQVIQKLSNYLDAAAAGIAVCNNDSPKSKKGFWSFAREKAHLMTNVKRRTNRPAVYA